MTIIPPTTALERLHSARSGSGLPWRGLGRNRLLGLGICSCLGVGIAVSASSPQSVAAHPADNASLLRSDVDHLRRLLFAGNDVDLLPICTSILSMVLDDAQPAKAFPGGNMSWCIPLAKSTPWTTVRIVPEEDDRKSLDVVFSLKEPEPLNGTYASSQQLVSINLLVGAGGPEVLVAHIQHMPHRTPELEDYLLEHGPLQIGGSYRVSTAGADWAGVYLSAVQWKDGATTWTTALGEEEARNGRLVTTDELQLVGERVLALMD